MCRLVVFFFFKQKTEYEMRISDWSSDVCSSDLKTLVGSQRDLNMLLTKLGTPAFLFPDPTDLSQFYPTGEQKLSFSNVSPRVGIELHTTERIMLYGSFSKGFKSGGWTTRVASPVPPEPTKPADKQAPGFKPGRTHV